MGDSPSAAGVPHRPLPAVRPQRRWARRQIWLIFAAALAVALVVPLGDLWFTWQMPVIASVTFVPAQPSLSQTTLLIVTVRPQTAPLAHDALLKVVLDMQAMAMGIPPLHVSATGNHYQVALPLDMAGMWHIALALQVPAHAPWHKDFLVDVQGSQITTLALPESGTA
jgi:hypothetical protein